MAENRRFSLFLPNFQAHYRHVVADMLCTKIAKNLTFFELFKPILNKLYIKFGFSGQFVAHYRPHIEKWFVQKIALFLNFFGNSLTNLILNGSKTGNSWHIAHTTPK